MAKIKSKKQEKKKRQPKDGTVVRGGARINENVYSDVMKIGKRNSVEFPLMLNIALKEFAEKYKTASLYP